MNEIEKLWARAMAWVVLCVAILSTITYYLSPNPENSPWVSGRQVGFWAGLLGGIICYQAIKMRHLNCFLQDLRKRKIPSSSQKSSETDEIDTSKRSKDIALISVGTLLIMVLLGSLTYYNESHKILVESKPQYSVEITWKVVHKALRWYAFFEIDNKRLQFPITISERNEIFQKGRLCMTIEHWRGGLWGEAYVIGKTTN